MTQWWRLGMWWACTGMQGMKQPRVPDQETPVLTHEQVKALLATCAGTDFTARRDAAILRTFLDTGARLAEVAGLTVDRVDLDAEVIVVLGGLISQERPHGVAVKVGEGVRAGVLPQPRQRFEIRRDGLVGEVASSHVGPPRQRQQV